MIEEVPRLYLITPPIADAGSFAATFEATLDAAEFACVLLRTDPGEPGVAKKIVRALAPLAQKRGVACLVEDAQLAVRADADGAHVAGLGDRLEAAIESLRPEKIVGAGGLGNRDDAMMAGEADVDYLMFGGPDESLPFAEILERVSWWAEIFNLPCIAYAHKLEEISEFAQANVDFVALCDAIWANPRGAAPAAQEAASTLAGLRETAK
jgi:thiamine-phosphate pyrophosphorylase